MTTNKPSPVPVSPYGLEELSKESRQIVLESGLVASQLAGLVFPDFNPVQVRPSISGGEINKEYF